MNVLFRTNNLETIARAAEEVGEFQVNFWESLLIIKNI